MIHSMYHCAVGYDWAAWGERLRRLRNRRGMTQAELAARVDVARNTINRIEHALAAPSIDLMERLADALDLSLPTLLRIPRSRGRGRR
jgi:transcriptional regulator with XRE-family HTH domain